MYQPLYGGNPVSVNTEVIKSKAPLPPPDEQTKLMHTYMHAYIHNKAVENNNNNKLLLIKTPFVNKYKY